jgi:septum formation protein
VLDDEVFGKPRDDTDAARMLRALSGRMHRVVSSVSLVSASRENQAISVSEVTFASLSADDIARYVSTGEPQGKAGAYAIQGAAQAFIAHLSGSYSGVMGLPLFETAHLLKEFGITAPRPETPLPHLSPVSGSGEVGAMRNLRPRTTSPSDGGGAFHE